jgi:hypothetical protein
MLGPQHRPLLAKTLQLPVFGFYRFISKWKCFLRGFVSHRTHQPGVLCIGAFGYGVRDMMIGLFFLRRTGIMSGVGRVGARPGKMTTVTTTSALWPSLVHLL